MSLVFEFLLILSIYFRFAETDVYVIEKQNVQFQSVQLAIPFRHYLSRAFNAANRSYRLRMNVANDITIEIHTTDRNRNGLYHRRNINDLYQ